MTREDIKAVGDALKQRRKEMNLSLKEAENATSIRMAYLQAIEDGDMSKLISPVYAQGFLKQYAAFLGLDGEEIVRENQEHFTRETGQEFSYGIGTLEVRGNPGAGIKWLPNLLWLFAFTSLFALAWGLAKYFEVM